MLNPCLKRLCRRRRAIQFTRAYVCVRRLFEWERPSSARIGLGTAVAKFHLFERSLELYHLLYFCYKIRTAFLQCSILNIRLFRECLQSALLKGIDCKSDSASFEGLRELVPLPHGPERELRAFFDSPVTARLLRFW